MLRAEQRPCGQEFLHTRERMESPTTTIFSVKEHVVGSSLFKYYIVQAAGDGGGLEVTTLDVNIALQYHPTY